MKIYMEDLHKPIGNDELRPIDETFQIINARVLMRKMKSVCESATKFLKQVKTNDLSCCSNELLQQKSEIENNLRRMIVEAEEFCK